MKILEVEVIALADEDEANALYAETRQESASRLPYCEEDKMCTPEVLDDDPGRYFLVEKTVFYHGLEETLPSTHYAHLASLRRSLAGEAYVVRINVILPEQEPGSTQAADLAQTLETCALAVIER